MQFPQRRVAIVHDWLYTYAGAERVLEQILKLHPNADLFSLFDFLPDQERGFLQGHSVTTSLLQGFPGAKKHHRAWLPFFPLAIESFDFSSYDLIISSSYSVAKGILSRPGQQHICYCHSPMRYAWDLQEQYLRESGISKGFKGLIARAILHYLRMWDVSSAPRVDTFIANSRFVGQRIKRCYGRSASVIYPPVNTEAFKLNEGERSDYYVTASRMVPYKKMDLIVEAFAKMPSKRLVVIGDGPGMNAIRKIATPNIKLLGFQPQKVLINHLQRAKAFIFAAEEDFGIAPVEAQACGTPVLAFGKGGALETIRGLNNSHPTGHFFNEQSVESLTKGLHTLESNLHKIFAYECRENAMRFSGEAFRESFSLEIEMQTKLFSKLNGAESF